MDSDSVLFTDHVIVLDQLGALAPAITARLAAKFGTPGKPLDDLELDERKQEHADDEVEHKNHAIALQVVPVPDLGRDLPGDDHAIARGHFGPRLNEERAGRREENAVSDAERGEDCEDPSEPVTDWHGDGQVLQDVDDDHEEAAGDEVQEERHDLRVDVRLEEEGGHVGERHDRGWEEQEKEPDALIMLIKDERQHDNQTDWDVRHENVENNVGSPVSS